MADWNTKIIEEFRANGGKVESFGDVPLLLLTTTGARTGEPRTSPLAFRREGDALVVFGTYAGQPKHPMWYFNVRANPDVTVELGTETFPARARVAEGDERARIWEAQRVDLPAFADYEAKTDREFPVVVLERA